MRFTSTMLPAILTTIFLFSTAFGGTLCPPRENVFPCSCANIMLSKKLMHTIVNCHHISSTKNLIPILTALRGVQIDQFHLYNSFWESHKLGAVENQVLPTDWLTLLRAKEIEIFDTALSSGFACQSKQICKNTVSNRFTAVNSSTSEKLLTLCDTGKGNAYSWIGCMNRLKYFEFSHGKLITVGADLFPTEMRDLLVVNLTHNDISLIKPGAFQKLKRLTSLDLSNNRIEYFDFFTTNMNLEFLDLSWNRIKEIGDKQITSLPRLKSLMLSSNDIVELKESSWEGVPSSLKLIGLDSNPINCDCGIQWINSTFHINVVIEGTCSTPEDYEDSQIRKASRMLIERCDEDGYIGTRTKLPVTKPYKLF
ncbi:uncharacterized protein TNCT_396571 [Trichonephila clavata]|uniref:Uncharacterized protein n=1 Tax=Trichonephila clavata TaxID=2740835 RepID=A0A8X6FRI0_TRICU|nr:uncharacterized protein TNCT_396571 [Trichonephila clavata]